MVYTDRGNIMIVMGDVINKHDPGQLHQNVTKMGASVFSGSTV